MTKNNSVDDVYTRICKLGSGSYGTVYLAQRKQAMHFNLFQSVFKPNLPPESEFMAVKIYKKPDNNR
jgi:serine/threonine protein kinase